MSKLYDAIINNLFTKNGEGLENTVLKTLDKLKEMCFAHPTYSEGIFDAICRIT